jgi:hypothetical protein
VPLRPVHPEPVEGCRIALVILLLACGCGPTKPPPKDPPQVTISVAEPVVAAPTLKVRINVVGCEAVSDLKVQHNGYPVRTVTYTGNPTEAVMQPADFNTYYNSLGIAIGLTLSAKAECDDGRTNTSQPLGVRFFPVASALATGPQGAQAMPDSFVAEGGVGNTPVTFVGCIGTANGTALARVNLAGEVIGANLSLPFPCSYASTITEKNTATGHRWLLEAGRGAFAFDSSLNINGIAPGSYTVMGVAPNGDAILWDPKASQVDPSLFRVTPNGGAFPANRVWGAAPAGILNASPVVDNLGTVFISTWAGTLGSAQGTVVIQRFNFATGALINPSYPLVTFEYGDLDSPEIPNGAFNATGSVIYFPYQSASRTQSRVMACATTAPDCQGTSRKWLSPLLDTVGLFALPYSRDTLVAVIGAQKTYFLNEATGAVVNLFEKPITADGQLFAHAVQPGLGTEFYVFNGPARGYPIEIVAVDAPDKGELWRYQLASGGELPSTAVYLAVDDSGQAWIRSGLKQIKPFLNQEYRFTKGANPP